MSQCMATTMDNPYNPFTHWDEWLAYDLIHQYSTCQLVAAFDESSILMDEDEYEYEVEQAINRLLDFDPFGIHIKVRENNADDVIKASNEFFNQSQLANIQSNSE